MTTNSNSQARPFRRSNDNRILGGVSGAIAERFGIDITTVRVAFALLVVLGGAGVPLYAAAWLLIPDKTADVSIAEDITKNLRWH